MTLEQRHVSGITVDAEELEELRKSLEKVVFRICPTWLIARRDDLVQMTVMKIIDTKRKSGEGIGPLKSSYMFRVAHNALVDEIRRQRRQREVALEDDDGATVELKEEHDPERNALSRETGRAIADCLKHMRQERRQAVTLYLQGHSVPDSARTLGWERKRTENFVFRGLMDLRQCLLKKGIRP